MNDINHRNMQPDMTELVKYEARDLSNGRVAILTLNRPIQYNPLDKHTIRALNTRMDEVLADERVRAVIVTGEGKAFSAGGDLKGYLDLYLDEPAFRTFLDDIRQFFDRLENGRLISIAAVNGACVAGGFEMALACDMIVMSRTAKMGDAHLKYWQLPGGGGTQRLPRAIGFAAAKRLLYSYELLDAEECRRIGLIGEVYEPERFIEQTLELANRLITTEPETVLTLKRLLKVAAETPLSEGLGIEIDEVTGHAIGKETTAYRGLLRFTERPRA
jgi:enoyl-CoA hydratase/carnithine racemase